MTFGGFGVLEKKFIRVYTKFKLHFYRETFARFQNREASLTTVESFAMEAIYALGNPTVRQFAEFMGISSSNAAYKTASLVRKGYLIKERSKTDAREYHLVPTQKVPGLLQRERRLRTYRYGTHQEAFFCRGRDKDRRGSERDERGAYVRGSAVAVWFH